VKGEIAVISGVAELPVGAGNYRTFHALDFVGVIHIKWLGSAVQS
jgi:hypothetical protein